MALCSTRTTPDNASMRKEDRKVASVKERVIDIVAEQLGVSKDRSRPRPRLSTIWARTPWIRSNW